MIHFFVEIHLFIFSAMFDLITICMFPQSKINCSKKILKSPIKYLPFLGNQLLENN